MFKKIITWFILSAVISSMLVISASADSDGQINAMYVRFRSGPGTDYSVIETYSSGKNVTVLGYEGLWAHCRIDGVSGYIFSDFVSEVSSAPIPANISPSSADLPVHSSQASPPSVWISSYGGNTGNGIIVVPPSDATTNVSSSESASNPKTSFAPVADINLPSPGGIIISPGQNQPSVSYPAAASSPSLQAVTTTPAVPSAKPAPPAKTPAPVQTPQAISTGTITGDYVRFRTGPSTTYTILGSYDKGKVLSIEGISGEWTKCIIDSKSGYVFSKYVKRDSTQPSVQNISYSDASPATPVPASGTGSTGGYIIGNNVRLRSGPSLDSKIIGELYYANSVTITGHSGDWAAVSCSGKAGYVFGKYVKEGSPSIAASPASNTAGSGISATGQNIADFAMQQLGAKYCWGGKDPSTGFDCSGLVYYVYKHFGITLNRVAHDQATNGRHIDPADLQPGDVLCFYSSGTYIGHNGIYIGDGKFIHAATSTTGVIITELSGNYLNRGFEARRMV